MPAPTFSGSYAPDGKALRAQVRADAGHRCIRCGHPYQTGIERPDRGEWSDCDEKCKHGGNIRVLETCYTPSRWREAVAIGPVSRYVETFAMVQARWRILTVHHMTGQKDCDLWWNCLALCQVCHLSVQTRVNPEIPWMFDHSDWFKPYVAGFYSAKYERNPDITREEVMARLPELLAYECRIVPSRPEPLEGGG